MLYYYSGWLARSVAPLADGRSERSADD